MKPPRQSEHSMLQQCTAVVFVLLMIGFGFVQAVHVHNALAGESSSPASHCSLCVVAHHAAAVLPVSVAPMPVTEVAILAQSDPQPQSRQQVGATFIRPPPRSL
jgi:hypothetical protein